MSGPSQFFPPIPINEPGNGPQGVTLVSGVPTFVPGNPEPALSTDKGAPLEAPLVTVPPITFQQIGD